jgi:transposase
MGARFIGCDRDQVFLMPPSLRDWVPEGHLVWTVLDAVAELDLSAIYADYRDDGRGRPAYEPSMMVALLLYAYARGNRSSRGIERACVEDIAYRVVTGNLAPDHSTIAEFRRRHERPLGELFSGVLALCARAGLVSVGVVAIDGTKMAANASSDANRDFGQIAREILAEAAEIDRREDELYGSERGDELPEQLRTREGRRRALREAKERLARERDNAPETPPDDAQPATVELDPGQFVTRPQGRRAWVREGRRALDAEREREARPIAKNRTDRLFEACRRLEEELDVEHGSHAAYDAWRARGVAADGSRRMAPGMVKPHQPVLVPAGLMNVTDHDSRPMRTHGYAPLQGYNAQAATNEQQIVIAAEVMVASPDFGHLEPMLSAARAELEAAGVSDTPQTVLARRRLLPPSPDRTRGRRRHTGAHPAGLQAPHGHPARLGRRALRVHAPRPGDRAGHRALPTATTPHRAGVRQHQVQPQARTLPPTRQISGPHRVAPHRRDPQPPGMKLPG